jgi:AsmA protein
MRLIKLLFGLVVVFVLVLVAGLLLLPGDRIASMAADELSRRTGRDVQIAGDANISFWPELGVTVGALRIANADWSENGPLFQAQSVTIGVDAAALIGGDIKIRGLRAEGPEILLERNEDGVGNWEIAFGNGGETVAGTSDSAPAASSSEPAAPPASRLSAFTLDEAKITGASVYLLDRQAGTEFSLRNIDLALAYPRAGGPADVTLTLRPNGEPITLDGQVQNPLVLADGRISPVVMDVTAPGAKGRFEGRASILPEAQGSLSLDVTDTGKLAVALRQANPGLPAGLGRDVKLTTQLTLTRDGQLALREGQITSGTNKATLAADLDTSGARPRLNAQLVANALDLSALTSGPAASGNAAAPAAAGWSTAPIDASALGLMDAEIALTAPSVKTGITDLGTTRILITIDRARAVASLREVQAFGGTLTGELVANNRSGLSVGGKINASTIALQKALTDLAGITRFTGDASANLSFLGVGQNMAAIMNSLSGDGSLSTGRGTIEGIDLDKLFRSGDVTGGTTIFEETTASFSMQDGVVSNDDLRMKLSLIEATGEGKIGLGQQNIDYLFTPIAAQARDGRGLALPVTIRGPWAKPKISVDLEKAIQLNAAEERKQLEEKAKQEIGKKLGVEIQEGERPEDALKRKLEEEAKRGLLNLFK